MDQLELLPDDEVEDFGVFTDIDPFEFHYGMAPADFPKFVDGLLPDDPADGARRESGYTARLNEYLDVVAADQKQLAMRAAHRARSIDAARMWSLVSDEFVLRNPLLSDSERAEWAHRVFVSEVRALLRVPQPTASRLIDDSRTLVHELPGTLAALEAGTISYRHAQVILDQARTLPFESRAAFEQALLPDAVRLPVGQLRRTAIALRERLHPDSIRARKRAATAERRLAFEAAPDGMGWLSLFAPAGDVLAAFTRVDEIARRRQHPTDPRTLAQLRADVAVELLHDGELFEPGELAAELQALLEDARADRAGAGNGTGDRSGGSVGTVGSAADRKPVARKRRRTAHRGIRPTVIVTVPVFTLLGLSEEPASLDGYGPIDADTARELCAKAPSFLRLLVNPETGVPLSLGTEHYRVPKDLRTWLETRDGTCRGPNCGQPATTTEIDHTVAYGHGGPTDAVNLACLCAACHRLKHASTWTPVTRGNGIIDWTSPTGRVYTTRPALDLPGTSLPETRPPAVGLPETSLLEGNNPETGIPETGMPSVSQLGSGLPTPADRAPEPPPPF